MTRLVRFEPEADDEYQYSLRYLELARDGFGELFRAEVQRMLQRISNDPFRFRRVHGDVRRAFVRRFDYWIYYIVEKDEIIVAAVFSCSRDPEELRQRDLL